MPRSPREQRLSERCKISKPCLGVVRQAGASHKTATQLLISAGKSYDKVLALAGCSAQNLKLLSVKSVITYTIFSTGKSQTSCTKEKVDERMENIWSGSKLLNPCPTNEAHSSYRTNVTNFVIHVNTSAAYYPALKLDSLRMSTPFY